MNKKLRLKVIRNIDDLTPSRHCWSRLVDFALNYCDLQDVINDGFYNLPRESCKERTYCGKCDFYDMRKLILRRKIYEGGLQR